MNPIILISARRHSRRPHAFTLVELLVTISIIALLAGITVGGMRHVSSTSKASRLRAELDQLVTAIESYKEAIGNYPPSGNVASPQFNTLFYELTGVVVSNATETFHSPMAPSERPLDSATVQSFFKQPGFANAAVDPTQVRKFFRPQAQQFGNINLPVSAGQVTVYGLLSSVPWTKHPAFLAPIYFMVGSETNQTTLNPWRYLAPGNATNNPGGYDLWVDYVDGKVVKRIGNWSREPVILN